MFGKTVHKTNVEIKTGVETFFSKAFHKFHIAIWSCMKFEDVLEVLPMFMLENFLDCFVFIWGHEQCSKTFGEISSRSHYYFKIWNVYIMLTMGKIMERRIKHYWLMMNLTRPFEIWNGLVFFLNHSGDRSCQRIRYNGWIYHPIMATFGWIAIGQNSSSSLWFMVKYSKPCLSSSSKSYYWFL